MSWLVSGVTTSGWAALERSIDGEVLLAGSRDHEALRRPAIVRFHDVRPQAVVRCRTPADVAETIGFARRSGLDLAIRSGGHCFAGRSSTSGVVLDVGPIDEVSASDGLATVGAGARLGDVYDALEPDGLTIAAGCGASVGIAGLTLGGGLGILGRKHGLTCDQLVRAEVVLADGRVVVCDEDHEAELFWALRGAGGGQFGVVTSLVLRTLPAPDLTTFHLVWPFGSAGAVVEAWQHWAPDGPDELAASLLVTAAADPDRPPVVHVFGAMVGSAAASSELLDGLVVRAGAEPATAALEHLRFRAAKRHLAEHGPGEEAPGHAFSKSEFFARPLPDEAIAALLAHLETGRVAGQARELDFSPWAGAYGRVRPDATAFAHRDARFLLKHGVVADPAATDGAREWLARSWALVHPWGTGGAYPNFPDPDLDGSARAYHGGNLERLQRVKSAYDPENVFRFHQSLQPRMSGNAPAFETR